MTTLNLQVSTSASDAHAGAINNDSGRAVATGANIASLTDNPLSPGSHGGVTVVAGGFDVAITASNANQTPGLYWHECVATIGGEDIQASAI